MPPPSSSDGHGETRTLNVVLLGAEGQSASQSVPLTPMREASQGGRAVRRACVVKVLIREFLPPPTPTTT